MLIRNCLFFPQEVCPCVQSAGFSHSTPRVYPVTSKTTASLPSQDKFELKFNGSIAVAGQVQTLFQELSQFASCRNSTHNDPPFRMVAPPECFELGPDFPSDDAYLESLDTTLALSL